MQEAVGTQLVLKLALIEHNPYEDKIPAAKPAIGEVKGINDAFTKKENKATHITF